MIIALTLGIVCGTLTGLTPGLHTNLLAALVAAAAWGEPIDIAVFLTAAAITHTFLDAIPAVFLGVAEGGELVTLTPVQKMVMAGKGLRAVFLLTTGALFCLVLGVAGTPFFAMALPATVNLLKPYTAPLLITITLILVIQEKGANSRFWSTIIVALAAVLGLIVLRGIRVEDPLLPMLSGLFGCSGLVYSALKGGNIPPQNNNSEPLPRAKTSLSVMAGTAAGGMLAVLPGLGPAQAAIAFSSVAPALGESFLVLVGGINTVNMALSLVTLSTLGFARNGAFEIVSDIFHVGVNEAAMLSSVALLAGGIAAAGTVLLARPISRLLSRLNYPKVSALTLVLVTALVTWRSGLLGLVVLMVSTAIGLIPILTGSGRHHLMACITIPVIWATF